MKEFDLIEKYFASIPYHREDVILGIGDDAAVLQVPQNKCLVSCTDSFVEGTHFFVETPADAIGYKSLAVNLSDLAAMGATPCWVSLALTLPSSDENWIKKFVEGFSVLVKKYNLQIIGGDTTRGPLSVTPQVLGVIDPSKILRRDMAKSEDIIYVTGDLGEAAFAVDLLKKNRRAQTALLNKLYYPHARVAEGQSLGGIVNAVIDISDGLLADLRHILDMSQVGAVVYPEKLPLSPQLRENVSSDDALHYALYGGDDYELCFTVSKAKEKAFQMALDALQCPYTAIGHITTEKNLYLKTPKGCEQIFETKGYQHF